MDGRRPLLKSTVSFALPILLREGVVSCLSQENSYEKISSISSGICSCEFDSIFVVVVVVVVVVLGVLGFEVSK